MRLSPTKLTCCTLVSDGHAEPAGTALKERIAGTPGIPRDADGLQQKTENGHVQAVDSEEAEQRLTPIHGYQTSADTRVSASEDANGRAKTEYTNLEFPRPPRPERDSETHLAWTTPISLTQRLSHLLYRHNRQRHLTQEVRLARPSGAGDPLGLLTPLARLAHGTTRTDRHDPNGILVVLYVDYAQHPRP